MNITDAPSLLAGTPSWLLNQAALEANRQVGHALEGLDAHRSEIAVLAALAEFGPDSQAALGRRCGIDRSDMVALVDRLRDAGHLQREQDPRDRRRNRISLTSAGWDRLGLLDDALASAQDRFLGHLSAADRRQLVALLTRILPAQPPAPA